MLFRSLTSLFCLICSVQIDVLLLQHPQIVVEPEEVDTLTKDLNQFQCCDEEETDLKWIWWNSATTPFSLFPHERDTWKRKALSWSFRWRNLEALWSVSGLWVCVVVVQLHNPKCFFFSLTAEKSYQIIRELSADPVFPPAAHCMWIHSVNSFWRFGLFC